MKKTLALAGATLLSLWTACTAEEALPSLEIIPAEAVKQGSSGFDSAFQAFCDKAVGERLAKELGDAALAERTALLAEGCLRHLARLPGAPNASELYGNGASELLFEERKSAVLDTWLACALWAGGGRGDAQKRITEALAKTSKRGADADPAVEFFARFVNCAIQPNDATNRQAATEALARCYRDGAFEKRDGRAVYALCLAWLDFSPSEADGLLKALTAAPALDPWLKKTLEAKRLAKEAARSRSSSFKTLAGLASRDASEEALEAAEEAWKANPELPEAPLIALETSKPSEAKEWFQRAVAAQFDCLPAYELFIKANAKSPETLAALARDCVRTGRYDTRVPFLHFDCLARWSASLPPEKWQEPFKAPGEREALLALLAGLKTSEAVSDRERAELLLKTAYALAWAGEKGKALELLKEADPKLRAPQGAPWSRFPRAVLESSLLVEGSPFAELCQSLDKALENGQRDEAAALARELAKAEAPAEIKASAIRKAALLLCGLKPAPQIQKLDPLRMAVATKSPDAMKLLLELSWIRSYAPPESAGEALRTAVAMKDGNAVSLLLEGGADPSAKDASGQTPLHVAAKTKGSEACAKALLAKGASASATDLKGRTPAELAGNAGNLEFLNALSAKEAK